MSFPPPAKKLKQSTLHSWKKTDNTAQESLCGRNTAEGESSRSSASTHSEHKDAGRRNSQNRTNQTHPRSLSMANNMGGEDNIDPTSKEEEVWGELSDSSAQNSSTGAKPRTRELSDESRAQFKAQLEGGSSGGQGAQDSSTGAKPRTRALDPVWKKQHSMEEEERESRRPAGGQYHQKQQHQGHRSPYPNDPGKILGVAINQLKTSSPTTVSLPLLDPVGRDHTVLTDQFTSGRASSGQSQAGKGYKNEDYRLWHQDYVKMPFSKNAKCTVTVPGYASTFYGSTSTEPRWDLIHKALEKDILQFRDLKKAILSYNDTYKDLWTFGGLEDFIDYELDDTQRVDFYNNVLPRMAELALRLPDLCSQPIPLLKRKTAHSITLSQEQAACLLANAFFCTFPHSNSRENRSPVPGINFSRLYRDGITSKTFGKLRCLLHYFKTVTEQMPRGNITYSRQVLKRSHLPDWENRPEFFPQLRVDSGGTIEDDGEGMLQADFANKYIGGGVLGEGCVQEEIRFVICPELLVSLLFTEVLEENEAVVITGSQRYSHYKGYASSFEWAGEYEDPIARDSWGRRCTQVTAIDAINVKRDVDSQFDAVSMRRELNKAFVGFYDPYNQPHKTAVATGNWGCGAFGGDSRLKALIQLMAAAVAGRDVCYFTYKDNKLTQDIYDIHQLITDRRLTVGNVWELISEYSRTICGGGRGGGGGHGGGRGGGHGRGHGTGQGVYLPKPNAGGSGYARSRQNVFEFITEKVQPTSTSRHTPSSPGDPHSGVTAPSYDRSHHSTSGSSHDHPSHSAGPTLQRTLSNQREEDNHGGGGDDENDWNQKQVDDTPV